MSEPNYKEEYSRMIVENFENFDINDPGVKIKIQNFCSKFGFDENEVIQKIKLDKVLRAWFIKDPSKQNVFEKTFANFLSSIKKVKNFKKLPTSGKGSVFIINQEVRIKGDADKSITSQAKSMDFYFEYEGINVEFYVFHKYTNEAGGAQDNQRNDVTNAIDKASNPHINKKIFILFVCDGEYYVGKNWDDINAHISDSNFKLLKSGQIEKFLETYK